MPLNEVSGHAFVSYVREDAERVGTLVEFLESYGIDVWLDRDKLWPGDDWRIEIRRAIQQNALAFIACFSTASITRIGSYQNEELRLAIKEYRFRQPGTPWLFPVRFDDIELPPFDLDAGNTLGSLQWCDLFGPRREANQERLAASIARVINVKPRSSPEAYVDLCGALRPTSENNYQTAPTSSTGDVIGSEVRPTPGLHPTGQGAPNSKQRRKLARLYLERLRGRWRQWELRRRNMYLIYMGVGVLALLSVVSGILMVPISHPKSTPASTPPTSPPPIRSPSPIASRAAKSTSGPCGYTEDKSKLTDGTLFDVGLPPDPRPTPIKSYAAVFSTNLGTIRATLDGKNAPCNVQSVKYLISKKFYDQTTCPRSVDSAVFGVQCGDPSGTTDDGPTYTTKDESLIASSYTAGTLIMANRGPDTNSSQIFFFTKDSNPALKEYFTVIGHVTDGLTILQKVGSGGNDNSNPAGGGKPNVPLYITTVTIQD